MPEKPLLVYNFAQGGDTVWNMEKKIEGPYQELIKSKCKPGEDWNPATSLFVFWIGINNIGYAYDIVII
ncbi:hypothetical protein FS749_013644 [Ceratobasidium sp. UAMH 11750]|nr:hypothetical protein FS749_013644 [Ceratobasidium sp. UAMH 11750]